MRKSLFDRRLTVFLLAIAAPALALTQDADEEGAESQAPVTEEAPLELEEQRVTGSRMLSGDPSARVYSLSAEDIARRGVSSLEELFRTLPWAFPSITTQSNMHTIGTSDTDKSLGALGLGTSTINLRALGSANTLVLVNGRRVAGLAGDEDSLTNILNVPLSALERVDIQLDGASAVYGADAIGGIVNFITKKDYQGLAATYREEFSSTDANRRNLSVQGGYAWGSGNITATVSRDRSEPINNFKIWTSNDFRDQYGPEFDKRSRFAGQPGVVCDFNGSFRYPGCRSSFDLTTFSFVTPRYQLPQGHSGVGATPADFTTDITPTDYVSPQNGEDSTTTSFNVAIEQYLTDDLRVYADALISNLDSWQQFQTTMSNYLLPASNAYNPFDRIVLVSYWPIREVESGLIPAAYTESENKQRNYNAGLFWELGGSHQLEFNITRSESEKFAWQVRTDWRRGEFNPTQKAFYSALESSDPNVALNLFGDGTAQGSAFAELFTPALGPSRGFSEVTSFEPLLRGQLFNIWGGPINYAVGAEFREEVIYRSSEAYREGGLTQIQGNVDVVGVEEPTEELTAYFMELAIPIVGPKNARPGLQSLVLSLQARRDNYTFEGASGGVDAVRVPGTTRFYVPGTGWTSSPGLEWTDVGTPSLIETEKGATSPRVGLQYKPVDSLIVRTAWSKSFQPPVFGDQFSTENSRIISGYFVDPYHPDGFLGYIRPPATLAFWNPELKSEFSNNYSAGFDWTSEVIAGLRWTVDWSRVDFSDKIESSSGLLFSHPDVAFALPEIVQRDAAGYITHVDYTLVNIAEKISEILETTVQYAFTTKYGEFTPQLSYTRVLDEYFSVTPQTDPVDRVGTASGSNEYRLDASLSWTWNRFAADVWVRYIPSYENDRAGSCPAAIGRCERQYAPLPMLKVDALTTVDLTLTYLFDNGLRVRAGGRNIFDEDSPTIWNNLPYDPTRWDARGRVLFAELHWEM